MIFYLKLQSLARRVRWFQTRLWNRVGAWDIEPGFVAGSDREGRMQIPDELRRGNEALRDRIFRLTAANLRIGVSLDVHPVLREVFERAWSLPIQPLLSERRCPLSPILLTLNNMRKTCQESKTRTSPFG